MCSSYFQYFNITLKLKIVFCLVQECVFETKMSALKQNTERCDLGEQTERHDGKHPVLGRQKLHREDTL